MKTLGKIFQVLVLAPVILIFSAFPFPVKLSTKCLTAFEIMAQIQRAKSNNGSEGETVLSGGVHKLNGSDSCYDASSPITLPKSTEHQESSQSAFASQVHFFSPASC